MPELADAASVKADVYTSIQRQVLSNKLIHCFHGFLDRGEPLQFLIDAYRHLSVCLPSINNFAFFRAALPAACITADDQSAAAQAQSRIGRSLRLFHSRAVNMAAEMCSLQLANPQNAPSPAPSAHG